MEHAKTMLSEYLDRELPEADLRRVESHLAACPECRRELEELRSVSQRVQNLPREPLPAGFLQRLERRRRQAEAPAASRFLLPLPARVAAFALSSIVVLLVVRQKFEPSFPETASILNEPASAPAEEPFAPSPESRRGPAAARLSGEAAYEGSLSRKASAKAVPRLAGAPAGVSAAPPRDYTNEVLHEALESEKRRMGIRNILARSAPQARMASLGSIAQGGGSAGTVGVSQDAVELPPEAAALSGNTPALLSISGHQSFVDTFTLQPGLLIRSLQEQAKAWQEKSIASPAPRVDYDLQMLVLVFPRNDRFSVEIVDATELADRLIVRYREIPLSPPASTPPQFRVVSRNKLPVLFQKLP